MTVQRDHHIYVIRKDDDTYHTGYSSEPMAKISARNKSAELVLISPPMERLDAIYTEFKIRNLTMDNLKDLIRWNNYMITNRRLTKCILDIDFMAKVYSYWFKGKQKGILLLKGDENGKQAENLKHISM